MRHLKLWCLTNGDESGGWRTRRNNEVLYGTAALRDVRWVAGMVAYLAGTEAGFVTGVNLSPSDSDGAKRLTRTNPDELEFHEGAWFVVREGTAYEIETRTGYSALAGYKMG